MNKEDLDKIKNQIENIEEDSLDIAGRMLLRSCRDLIYVIEDSDIVHE